MVLAYLGCFAFFGLVWWSVALYSLGPGLWAEPPLDIRPGLLALIVGESIAHLAVFAAGILLGGLLGAPRHRPQHGAAAPASSPPGQLVTRS